MADTTRMLGENEREIFEFLRSHLEVRVTEYSGPPSVQLVLCGEIISESELPRKAESVDGY